MSSDQCKDAHPPLDNEKLAIVVDVWKHSVKVQMHFNEMGMKVRNLYFTILAAAVGVIGSTTGRNIEFLQVTMSASILVVIAIIPISMLFYFIDRDWYHRLLKGAVYHCMDIENQYKKQLPEIQLGSKISEESPVKVNKLFKYMLLPIIYDKKFRKEGVLHSNQKIEVIYRSAMACAFLIVLIYGGFHSIRIGDKAILISAWDAVANWMPCVRCK